MRHAEADRGDSPKASQDLGLTDAGRVSAELAASRLITSVDHIVTSPLPRAVQTAEIVARSLGCAEILTIEALREIGEFAESSGYEYETLPKFFDRVAQTMNQIADTHPSGTTLVITHAGFIMGSIRALFHIPTPGSGSRLEPDLLSLTEWVRREDVWELRYFNLSIAR